MDTVRRRLRKLEKEIPPKPCNHPLGILVDPTDEEVEKFEQELASCPNIEKHTGKGPDLLIFHRFGTKTWRNCNCTGKLEPDVWDMETEDQTEAIPKAAMEVLFRRIIREELQAVIRQNGHQISKLIELATPYLTVKEAAKLSRLGTSTIRLAIRRRQLKANQVGSRVIIKRTDLEKFLEAHPLKITPDWAIPTWRT